MLLSMEVTLPYELLALEACLSAHVKGLEAEVAELESQSKPSLEHLLSSVRLCRYQRRPILKLHGTDVVLCS